jgi:hypothetical protein
MGDAIGREGQGGQAWLTYHLFPREMVQTSFRHSKAADDFIPAATIPAFSTTPNFTPGGTTQNSFDVRVVRRIHEYMELSAEVQHEWWRAPIYQPGEQTDTVATFQFTLHPERSATAP